MPRIPLLTLLALLLFTSGCYTLGDMDSRRYPDRRYPDRRYPDTRYPDRRYPRNSTYHVRIDRDVNTYVNTLDRRLRLDSRQERQIERYLADRTYDLLSRTNPRDHDRVYPFPRQFDRRERSTTVARWWDSADRQVERYLSSRQRQEYRYLTGDARYDRRDRDRYDRRDRDWDRDRDRDHDRDRDYRRGDRDDDRYERHDNRHRGKGKKKGHYKNGKRDD